MERTRNGQQALTSGCTTVESEDPRRVETGRRNGKEMDGLEEDVRIFNNEYLTANSDSLETRNRVGRKKPLCTAML